METTNSQQRLLGSHDSVMTQEVVELFAPLGDGLVLDATFGQGGHTRALLTQTSCRVFALDCDHEAVEYAHSQPFFQNCAERFSIAQGFFANASDLLAEHDIRALDGVLFDYGISSAQLDNPARGFSFQRKGPLDMRMAQEGVSAREFLQNVSEEELASQFRVCGERHARKIARALVRARAENRLPQDTQELADMVRSNMPSAPVRSRQHRYRQQPYRGQRDSATLVFMAIRIAVNDELQQIAEGLRQADSLLREGGRIVAISFHSLEDRIVKQQFSLWSGRKAEQPTPSRHRLSLQDLAANPRAKKKQATHARYRSLVARLQRPHARESSANPRARSAKLRAVEKRIIGKKNETQPPNKLQTQLQTEKQSVA